MIIISIITICTKNNFKTNTCNYYKSNTLIKDNPIKGEQEDILNFSISAKELSKRISVLDLAENSWSIGVVAPWGYGKSSFLNLIENELNNNQKQKYLIFKFYPRHSNTAKNIQKDFFIELCNILKPYNSNFSNMFNEYMNALMILDKQNIISAIHTFIKSTNKKDSKNEIANALKKIPCKIVIVIEDLDRLLANEILEIFKLIDNNASFPNIIFITAYDKYQINNIIGEIYKNEKSYFSDKFFNYEYYLPIRPSDIILTFIKTKIIEQLNINKDDEQTYTAPIDNNEKLLSDYIFSLRDAKRFINLLVTEYSLIMQEVNFRDFYLLTLLKFKDIQTYNNLYQKKYITTRQKENRYIALDNLSSLTKYHSIIEKLFPHDKNKEDFNNISTITAFDIYFTNQLNPKINNNYFELLLNPGNGHYKTIITEWNEKNQLNDLYTFLISRDFMNFSHRSQFKRFVECVFYTPKNKTRSLYQTAINLLYEDNVKKIIEKYKFTGIEDYKNTITQVLKETPQNHSFLSSLIINYIDGEFTSRKLILKRSEILTLNVLYFTNIMKDPNITENHLKLLYSCIYDMKLNSRKIILDPTCCKKFKRALEISPHFYLNKFVRLGEISSNPKFHSITCEPFWLQIFNSKNYFQKFIYRKESDAIENIELVRNFWRLFKNNEYKNIDSEGKWDAQEMINDNLNILIFHLIEIRKIKQMFEKEKLQLLNHDFDKVQFMYNCRNHLNVLQKNILSIKKREKLEKEIQLELTQYGKI